LEALAYSYIRNNLRYIVKKLGVRSRTELSLFGIGSRDGLL
jgi:DNA-binding NarL/FixJ family response regulator